MAGGGHGAVGAAADEAQVRQLAGGDGGQRAADGARQIASSPAAHLRTAPRGGAVAGAGSALPRSPVDGRAVSVPGAAHSERLNPTAPTALLPPLPHLGPPPPAAGSREERLPVPECSGASRAGRGGAAAVSGEEMPGARCGGNGALYGEGRDRHAPNAMRRPEPSCVCSFQKPVHFRLRESVSSFSEDRCSVAPP